MTKYLYYAKKGNNDTVELLKYKIVYQNQNFAAIISQSGTRPTTIKNDEIVDLSTDDGKTRLANLILSGPSYWGVYFDRNPYSEDRSAILEAKTKKEELRLRKEIVDKERYIKEFTERIEKTVKELDNLNRKLSSINEIKMELINDTTDI